MTIGGPKPGTEEAPRVETEFATKAGVAPGALEPKAGVEPTRGAPNKFVVGAVLPKGVDEAEFVNKNVLLTGAAPEENSAFAPNAGSDGGAAKAELL